MPWIVAALLAAGGGAWYAHSHRLPPKEAPPRGARGERAALAGRVPVAVAAVVSRDIRVTEQELGTVTPVSTVTVQTQISGQLMHVWFKEGQAVHKGDLLAEIDPRPSQAALAQAQGQLLRDQAVLNEARMDLDRFQQLAEKNAIDRQQAEDQKWTVLQDEGTVKVDEAQVTTARINLGYCRIVSPIDGRIGLRLVDAGNFAQVSSSTSLAVITSMQPMTVVFALPEDSLPAVMARQQAGATLRVQAYDRDGTHLLDTGTLTAIDSQINTSTGTANLKAEFPNPQDTLFPNQFVNVTLQVDTLPGATAVPTAAVQRGPDGPFVYRVQPGDPGKPGDRVAVTAVKLGPADGDHVAILAGPSGPAGKDGLKTGDRVVVDGADRLRDGDAVNIRGGPGP